MDAAPPSFQPTTELADALAAGDIVAAELAVRHALESGVPAREVLCRVIGPAMYEIGERWARAGLSVADEHLATSLCYQLLAVVYEHLLVEPPGTRGRVLLACVEGERHAIGLRMAADVLEGAGYDALHLGADVPTSDLIDAVDRHRPFAVALSATGPFPEATLAEVVRRLRAVDPQLGVVLGGQGMPRPRVLPARVVMLRDVETLPEVVARLARRRPDASPGGDVQPPRTNGLGEALPAIGDRDARFEVAAAGLADIARRHAADAFRLRLDARRLERMARVDPLTDLPNRRELDERLAAAVASAATSGMVPGLVLLDIDRFKQVNDEHGHPAGDAILREAASRIRDALEAGEDVARWGGEEFAIMVTSASDETGVVATATRVLEAIRERAIDVDGTAIAVTASAGAAFLRQGETLTEIVGRADAALYAAKRRGRDRVVGHADVRSADRVAEESPALRVARGLALATGVREGLSARHCEQVSDLAVAVAEELCLGDGVVTRCRLGGLLHDLGKLAMPDRILGKRGPLDDDEWAVMRNHAEIGAELARRIGGLEVADAAIAHHHERFDGGGYPAGLAGEAIPIEARIVAAADAFSAITTDRPYARGRDVGVALHELRRSAGTHFDPVVVGALCAVVDRLEEAAARYPSLASRSASVSAAPRRSA